jgi:phospholipid N-methyltransferase
MIPTLISLVPFGPDDPVKVIELGAGDATLTDALLTQFPRASVTVLEHDESVRKAVAERLTGFGDRVRLVAFDLSALDWWDRMFGADLVVSSMHIGALNDAKKQYLYKAVADRLSPRGVLLIADRLEPGQLLHHLVWLKHAGFALVDCFWRNGARAIVGGLKQVAGSAPRPPADS